jgi:hypothetical protein
MSTIEKKIDDKTILTFNEELHRFKVNGESVPGVTSITGIIDKSGPLVYWAVGLAADYLENIIKSGIMVSYSHIEEAANQHRIKKDDAANAGTLVHKWAERFITGQETGDNIEDPRIKNGVFAFLKWVKDTNIKFKESEFIVYSKKHKYAGILDLVAEIDGKLVLVDFKTSTGIYPEMFLQVAGYKLAYEEMTRRKIEKRIIVRFDKETGDFETRELPDSKKDEKAFLAALTLKNRIKEIKI